MLGAGQGGGDDGAGRGSHGGGGGGGGDGRQVYAGDVGIGVQMVQRGLVEWGSDEIRARKVGAILRANFKVRLFKSGGIITFASKAAQEIFRTGASFD